MAVTVLWLLVAVLTVWGVTGPLLSYHAGLAGRGEAEPDCDPRRIGPTRTRPQPPTVDELPPLPDWLADARPPRIRPQAGLRRVYPQPWPHPPAPAPVYALDVTWGHFVPAVSATTGETAAIPIRPRSAA